jgi:hypothetical protein
MLDEQYKSHQEGLHSPPRTRPPRAKIAKVLSIRPESHAIEVILLDGTYVRDIPMLSGWLGSTHGFAHLTAPTYDRESPARKTYPDEVGLMIQPSTNAEALTGRDQYAVLLELEGHENGVSGFVGVGFLPSQVSEMLFAKERPNATSDQIDEFADMLLFRHPSDLLGVIDRDATLSLQYPSGTRMTIGENLAPFDLTQKDYDELFELRTNLARFAGFVLKVFGSGSGDAAIQAIARGMVNGNLHLYGALVVYSWVSETEGGAQIKLTNSEIFIGSNKVTITTHSGNQVTLESNGDVTIHGNNVNITGTMINLNSTGAPGAPTFPVTPDLDAGETER